MCCSASVSRGASTLPRSATGGPERQKLRPHSEGEIAVNISETRTALFCCCRAFLFVFFFLSPPVWPQANQGTIEGIIVDQSGAALPGAKLTGTNDATGIHFQTTSDSNGRNFINFVLLTPGVTLDVRGGDISFAGQRGTLNSLIVDGSDDNNTFFGQSVGRTGSGRAPYQFSEDAVQEFQVNSSSYSAELGHAGGAVINVVTKSGSNAFHGAAFEFFRDRSLNANDPINKINGRQKSPYHFNQFGGDLGGPIVREKLFFFFDYDGQRNTLPNLVFLPVTPPATPSANQQTALSYLQARANSWIRTQNQNVYLGKADWRLGNRELLSVRYNSQRFVGNGFENGGSQNSSEHTGASDVTTDTVSGSLKSTISSSIVNQPRAAVARDLAP